MVTADSTDSYGPSQTVESGFGQLFSIRPEQVRKLPPCQAHCPAGGDVRSWLTTIAQHRQLGLTLEDAYRQAWHKVVERNPLPAVLGRICPHPCESNCNRNFKDGAVAINAMERFLGDWGLENKLSFPEPEGQADSESIGVIGSGPAGLSFAYQMARHGYPVTIYERSPEAGGMLRYGIPSYRLPKDVLAAEIQRILDLGIEIRLGTEVGKDIPLGALRARHEILFLGIGAQTPLRLRLPGEEGPGVWTGIEYLRLRNTGKCLELGERVVVIGGGNTAIDSARMARRDGAEVVLLYRRTRPEMPACASEIEEALEESVTIECLAGPTAIIRDGDSIRAVEYQRMALGEPDASGRRRPVPVPGSQYRLDVDSVITCVSQQPEWDVLDWLPGGGGWLETSGTGKVEDGIWAGGDDRGLGIASLAVGHGRQAAEALHAELKGLATENSHCPPIGPEQLKMDYYEGRPPIVRPQRPSEERLAKPNLETAETITSDAAQHEASRCLSCGLCFGCQRCWMYCNAAAIVSLDRIEPGAYFSIGDGCEGCGKCIEVCPSGFLSAAKT